MTAYGLCIALGTGCLVAGCSSPPPPTTPSTTSGDVAVTGTGIGPEPDLAPPPDRSPAPPEVSRRLSELRVAPRRPAEVPYRRGAFGRSWRDVDGNGCNQRDDVLLRDAVAGSVRVVRQGRCAHDVVAGTWVDPYTGRTLTFDDLKEPRQAQAIQIDHIVPLAEAWASGATEWSTERRVDFANDLDGLLAVDGPTNARKGDGDPAAWRPRKAFQCDYATRWIRVKSRWDLAVDPSEKRALTEMLATCRTGSAG